MKDLSRIHRFKRPYVEMIMNDPVLNELCEELWIFGSTVKGASCNEHRVFSDIDIGIKPIFDSFDDPRNLDISKSLHNILYKNGINSDHIWMFESHMKESPSLYKNIMKGERII